MSLPTDLTLVLLLLGAAIVMFAINRPRMDVVALLMLTALPFTGVITSEEALAGFSDPSIVLLAALFVVGEGLMRTGVARRIGDLLVARAAGNEKRLLALLMLAVGGLGAFMSSTGVVAIFIPVVLRLAQTTGKSPGQLMMPLSMAALTSGMLTLVATAPNLVVNSALERHGVDGFEFFSFTPFGLPILALSVAYMIVARRWLPPPSPRSGRASRVRPSLRDWIETYKLADREYRLRVTGRSPLVGRTIGELNESATLGANILAVERTQRSFRDLILPSMSTELEAGDVLLVDTSTPDFEIEPLEQRFALERIPLIHANLSDRSQEIGMVEAMVTADSELVGQTVADARLASRCGLTVVGMRHGRVVAEHDLKDEKLKIGHMLLLVGPWHAIDELRRGSEDLVVLHMPAELDESVSQARRMPQALFCLVLMVVLMAGGFVENIQAALIACLLMGALRCIDIDSAYRAIHWKSIVLIVGMLPFSLALQRTGGVAMAVDYLQVVTDTAGTHVLLGSLFLITALLGLFISNTATAVLMAPVALGMADKVQASPYPFAMIVALAASTAYMTPISSPVNTLVVAPGNYSFGDFVRVGAPFSLLVMIVSVLLVPWLLPLY